MGERFISECAIQLHHYIPQDEIDKGIICLFTNKSDPKKLFEALQEIIKNRENNLNDNKNNSNGNGNDEMECAIQLHHYIPQDEIDKGIICLFTNKSDPKKLFEALQEIIKNRENNLNDNKNNSNGNGNDEMVMMNQMIWSKLTRQIQEFQWIYLRDKF
ncbi:hypothetical protein Glove_33g53 [Diversispora epigaea]|uniref:Uncharacterized protein n=1 Tax=Diversispora epigaea TaxID=1348612 RepID=A0A397JK23_9GLOM|nr:hypothetical protein Glove_33g53 [Diversispora epigaea]